MQWRRSWQQFIWVNESGQDYEPEICARDIEPSCTEVGSGHNSYIGTDRVQDDEIKGWAEVAAVEPSHAMVQDPSSYCSELAGALDMSSNTTRLVSGYGTATESYIRPQSVLAQENLIQRTFAGDMATSFIPNIHQSSFSTLKDALCELLITYCNYRWLTIDNILAGT